MKELDGSDLFVRKVVKGAGLETPSANFTEKVKDRITLEAQEQQNISRPLITKKGWVGMAICILAIYGMALTQTKSFVSLKSVWTNLGNWGESSFSFLSQMGLSGFFIDILVYFLLVSLVIITYLKYTHSRKLRFNGAV